MVFEAMWMELGRSGGKSGTREAPVARTLSPRRVLSAPKRPKGTQERSKRAPETTKKLLQERLGALLRRFGRVLSPAGASRRGQGARNGCKINTKSS